MAIENRGHTEMEECGIVTNSEQDLRVFLQWVDSVTDPNSYLSHGHGESTVVWVSTLPAARRILVNLLCAEKNP